MRMSCSTSSVSCLQEKCYFSDDFYETATLNMQVLCDSTPCSLVNGTSRFTQVCCLNLQDSRVIQSPITALQMGVVSFSQTLLRTHKSVRPYTPDFFLQLTTNHVLSEFDIQRGG